MPATNSVFQMADSFFFDPQLHYAQVLAEARKNKQAMNNSPPQLKHPVIADVSCFSGAHFKAGEQHKSLDDLKKTKRSWKKSLFFWKKSEGEKKHKAGMFSPPRQFRGLKSKSVSGPIYMNNVHSSSRSWRSSGPNSGPLTPTFNSEQADFPYTLLNHINHPVPSSQPIYLIT
ncbi:hypothetical protein SUGI_0112540 [Cryptomeria japonica]|uniref:uncharacterized protein LOC131028213 n=1 Tax=Cryptomeria japonica TaxID=3369 RepID=UPI002408B277|nr:uncharacterized protein LOC131028213 [Cryptomeria japonica]GLJ09600.1 hypothetical protein SUGI_0112540 [Cryptomeria japonica]